MKLTTKSEYSILSLIYIARHQNGDYVKIDQICSYYNLPKKYLEQLLIVLKQNRFLKTRRGSGGGYKLARSANEISIADVIRLMDGALAPIESVSHYFYSQTPLEKEKKVIDILKSIRNYIANIMENTFLSDLL